MAKKQSDAEQKAKQTARNQAAKERRLVAAAQAKEIEGNQLLIDQANILEDKFKEKTKNSESLNDNIKTLNNLEAGLLTKLVDSKDNLEGQKTILEDHTKELMKHGNLRAKDTQTALNSVKALEDTIEKEEHRVEIQDILQSKADGMLDGLESQVKNIPLIGDMLASTLDFGGLKKQMGGILTGITSNFTTLTAGGMGAGKAIGKSFMMAIPQVAAFGMTLWAALLPILPIILAVIAAMYLIKKAFDFNQKAFDLARDLGISNTEARELSHSFDKIAASSKDLSITSAALLGAQKELTKEFGRSAKFSEQMLSDQIKLTKYGGLSADEAASFQKIAKGSGMETRKLQQVIIGMTKSYNDLTGDSINFKDINKEIIGLTKQQRSHFKGNHKEMALTVIEAKALGTTIGDINKAAEATLDIESSLKNEAKARMMTGVSINNNAIRQAQLYSKPAEVLRLQKKQLMEIGDFEHMRGWQQEAIAAAMGKSTEEILKQRENQRIMTKLQVKSLDNVTRKQLEEAGITGEKAEQILLDAEQLSAQEKSAASMEKLNDIMADMMGPIMDMIDPLLDLAVVIMPLLAGTLKFAFAPFVGAFDVISAIVNLVKGAILLFSDWDAGILLIKTAINDAIYAPLIMVSDMLDAIIEGLSFGLLDGFFKADADKQKETAGLQAGIVPTEKINDGIVKPDGTVVQTNPKDFIMAMMNPMDMFDGIGEKVGGLMSSVNPFSSGGGSTEIDYEKLAAAMSTRPIVLNIDGKSVSAISKVQNKQSSFRK